MDLPKPHNPLRPNIEHYGKAAAISKDRKKALLSSQEASCLPFCKLRYLKSGGFDIAITKISHMPTCIVKASLMSPCIK